MLDSNHNGLLIIGIGNNGRGDDALGWSFAEALENDGFHGDIRLCYQLQIEDVEVVRDYHSVLFVDAYKGLLEQGFRYSRCEPALEFSFSTHQLTPPTVLFLCRELYGYIPQAELLCISGKKWDLHIGMSIYARRNLARALEFYKQEVAPLYRKDG